MIERQGRTISFCCDACGEVRESDDEFAIAWRVAKDEGWKAKKLGEDWVHSCPDC